MNTEPTRCPSCGAPIEWLRTARGNVIPVDLEPDPAGQYVVDDGVLCYGPSLPDEITAGLERRTSHVASFHNARAHRKAVTT